MKGYLGPHKHSSEILQLVHGDLKFPCHLLRNAVQRLQNTDDDTAIELTPHCAGSLAYRNNTCKRGADPGVQQEMDLVGRRDDVFSNPIEMQLYHDGEVAYVNLGMTTRTLVPQEAVDKFLKRKAEAEHAQTKQGRSSPPTKRVGKVRSKTKRPRATGKRNQ